jgi:hypothetical protein
MRWDNRISALKMLSKIHAGSPHDVECERLYSKSPMTVVTLLISRTTHILKYWKLISDLKSHVHK